MIRRLLQGLLAALLAGCASPPPPQTEVELRREQIALAQQRGSRALASDDYRAAVRHYQLALDRSRALGDHDGVATGLLNLAAVQHRAGLPAEARARLTELLDYRPPFAAPYAGRAEARLALLDLQSNRIDEASRHAQRAEALCPASACAWRVALENVQAGIALRSGDLPGAEARARAALSAAAFAKDAREEMNARLLLQEITVERARAAGARGTRQ
jgi:tetratricopeptide (TPR) repeat protein